MSIAIIGGSGSALLLPDMIVDEQINIATPFGKPSSPIIRATSSDAQFFLLYRHGVGHSIPPHKINYRANIWALTELGIDVVVAIASVGGIRSSLKPGDLLLPDQLIDYTWGRESTFFDGEDGSVGHLEMTTPYSVQVRSALLKAADKCGVELADGGVYAATQGPRFETPAEVNRIETDGGDVVGMTGMPEAALAAEKGLCYACVTLIVNPAAGRGDGHITDEEIRRSMERGIGNLNILLQKTLDSVTLSEKYYSESLVMR